MVEVIKRGNPEPHEVFEVTCRGCGSELRFQAWEAEPYADRDGRGLKIDCVFCHRVVWKNL